jgi:SAM-dependent methyltransferase
MACQRRRGTGRAARIEDSLVEDNKEQWCEAHSKEDSRITPNEMKPRSPKLPGDHAKHKSAWYRYYAGYSADFVRDIVAGLKLRSDQLVADPWNGSGTTTAVADERGIPSWGGDINPAMIVIAKARLLGGRARPSELPICEGIIDLAARLTEGAELDTDPLSTWFKPEARRSIRALERSVASLLHCKTPGKTPVAVADLSPLASFFYVALFRTVRELLTRFRCSNPTWIRRPSDERTKLAPSRPTVSNLFRSHVRQMAGTDGSLRSEAGVSGPRVEEYHGPAPITETLAATAAERKCVATLAVAHSTALPIASRSVSAIVSSPPYCTRIDYAVATSPELAVLGLTYDQLRALREAMIGSSTVRRDAPDVHSLWGTTCRTFLTRVSRHPSKASSTYYLRNHLQYFDGLFRSLREADRVLTPGAPCVLVVQDSHYKDVHNDLPTIVQEMGEGLGWHVVQRHDYRSTRHMRRVHSKAQSYRRVSSATESVLVLETAS